MYTYLQRAALKKKVSYYIMLTHNVRGIVGGMAVEAESSHQYSSNVAGWQMAERQSDKIISDLKEHMKQRRVIKFIHEEKMAPIDTCWHLLNIYGYQPEDVRIVRWWTAVLRVAVGHIHCEDFYTAQQVALIYCWQKLVSNDGNYI